MLTINSAVGGPWEVIGAALVSSGQEDASGARRCIVDLLSRGEYAAAAQFLKCTEDEAAALWKAADEAGAIATATHAGAFGPTDLGALQPGATQLGPLT